jgi:hypothetical protein
MSTEEDKMAEVPVGIKIEVPEERFGDAYTKNGEREWVERRQRLGRKVLKQLAELENIYTDEEAFKLACPLLAQIFTDWNLSGDEGPLPKPWANAEAFEALMDSDVRLMLWVIDLVHMPMSALLVPEKN